MLESTSGKVQPVDKGSAFVDQVHNKVFGAYYSLHVSLNPMVMKDNTASQSFLLSDVGFSAILVGLGPIVNSFLQKGSPKIDWRRVIAFAIYG